MASDPTKHRDLTDDELVGLLKEIDEQDEPKFMNPWFANFIESVCYKNADRIARFGLSFKQRAKALELIEKNGMRP